MEQRAITAILDTAKIMGYDINEWATHGIQSELEIKSKLSSMKLDGHSQIFQQTIRESIKRCEHSIRFYKQFLS